MWYRWLAHLTFTQETGVRVPARELFGRSFFLSELIQITTCRTCERLLRPSCCLVCTKMASLTQVYQSIMKVQLSTCHISERDSLVRVRLMHLALDTRTGKRICTCRQLGRQLFGGAHVPFQVVALL